MSSLRVILVSRAAHLAISLSESSLSESGALEEIGTCNDSVVESEQSSSVVTQGSEISLHDWLRIHWFYPEEYCAESVVATEESLYAITQKHVLKFYRFAAGDRQEKFHWQFRHAHDEIRDAKVIAPNLYLGALALSWRDGEPHWIFSHPVPLSDIRPFSKSVDEIVLVMERIPSRRCLDAFRTAGELSLERTHSIVETLLNFQRHQVRSARENFCRHPQATLDGLRMCHDDELRQKTQGIERYLDPLSHMIVREGLSFVHHVFAQNIDELRVRGEHGLLVDGHGDLQARHVFFTSRRVDGTKETWFWGRECRDKSFMRVQDVLWDLAFLTTDLRARRQEALASQLEELYRCKNAKQFSPLLYRAFRVSAGLHQALDLLFGEKVGQSLALLPAIFGDIFRTTVNLPENFLLLCVGDEALCTNLLQNVRELTGDIEGFAFGDHEMGQLQFWSSLDRIERAMSQGRGVVVTKSFLNQEERGMLAQRAKSFQIPAIEVCCNFGRAERIREHIREDKRGHILAHPYGRLGRADAAQRFLAEIETLGSPSNFPDMRTMFFEPVIPIPDMALSILRELSRQGRIAIAEPNRAIGHEFSGFHRQRSFDDSPDQSENIPIVREQKVG